MTNVDKLWNALSGLTGHLPAWGLSAAVGVGMSVVALVVSAMVVRALRGKDRNAKSSIGFGTVQAGVAYITITGVYEFFHRLLSMPVAESWLLAAVVESAIWAAVGWIYAYGKGADTKGQPNEGFGAAGPFFWVTVIGGGTLAILGSKTSPVGVGRIVIVAIGAYMWYLRLLQVTRRSGKPSRWRWTPKRLLLAVGALEPADEDVENEAREWQVRRLARAMRWANSRWPLSWLGQRSLVHRAETTQEDVIVEARRRFAVAHLLATSVRPDSPVMRQVLAAVQAEHAGQADTGKSADTVDTNGRTPTTDTNGHVPAVADRRVVDLAEVSSRRRSGQGKPAADTVTVEVLADTLGKAFKDEYVGTPKALAELKRVYGSCSKERAIAAKDLHNARREARTPAAKADRPADSDDTDRELAVAR